MSAKIRVFILSCNCHKLKIVETFGSNNVFFLTFALSRARIPFGSGGRQTYLSININVNGVENPPIEIIK